MADNVEQLEARRWIDSLEDKWRLQILSKRQRLNLRTGERKDMPTRIRRFAEGIPWAYVAEGIRYLISKAPYRGIMFNGVRLDEEYRPTLTLWQRDAQDTVNSPVQRGGDSTYTLIQDLIAVDEEDLYGAVTSASCSEEVVSEWHWDEAQPGDIPQPTQGVTWQIAQVNRKEDGTFDYALIKRTALTQHTGETVVKDTTAELVRVDSWNNVYTDDQGRYTDNYGNLLDIPESHYGDGVACEVTRQINDDCTFRVNAQWTESKDATVRESCQKTQFEHEHSVSKVGQEEPLGEAPEASDGVVKRHEDQLQPDGRYSTVENTQTELPVEKARVRVTVGRRGRRVERTDRNQPVPASTEGLGIGQSVEVEKTPGKLYNNTTVDFDLSEKQRVAESCEIDLFKHDHSETVAGVDEIPGINEHVKGSGQNGDVKTRRTEMDDEGSVSQTNAVHHEKEVLKHRETWQVGLRGVRHSVTDTQTSPAKVPPPPTYSKENIGKSVSVEKTPGGLVNITTEDVARETPLDAGEGCAQTVFEHRDTTIANDPDGSFAGHTPPAGGGKYYENQSRLNEDGTSTVEQTEHNELEYTASEVEIRRTAKAVYRTTTDKNVKRTAQEPEGIGTSRHTTNPGGTHDVTTTTVDILNLPDRAHCAQTVFEHQHDKVEVSKGTQADSTDTPQAGGGHHFSKESSVDDMGVVTTVLRDNEELASPAAVHVKRKSLRGVIESVTDRNTTDNSVEVVEVGDEVRVERTPGGLYNRTVTRVSKDPVDKVGEHCAKTAFEHAHGGTRNLPDAPPIDVSWAIGTRGSIRAAMTDEGTWNVDSETVVGRQQTWAGGGRETIRVKYRTTGERNANSAHEVSGVGSSSSYRMNELGLFDGEYTVAEVKTGGVTALRYRNTYLTSQEARTENGAGPAAASGGGSQGQITDNSSRQNEDGSWDNTADTLTSTGTKTFSAGSRETIRVKYQTTGERNASDAHEVSGVGSSSSYRMNELGLLDGEYTVAELKQGGVTARRFRDTYLTSQVATTTTGSGSAVSPGGNAKGQITDNSSRQNEDGSWDNTKDKTTANETSYPAGGRETIRVKYRTTGERNVGAAHEVSGVGSSYNYRMNEFGLLDGEYTEAELNPLPSLRDMYSDSHLEHTELHTVAGQASDAQVGTPAVGLRTSSDSRLNEDGTWDNTSSATAGEAQAISISYTTREKRATYMWWTNQPRGYSQSAAGGLPPKMSNSVNARVNDLGLEDGSCSSTPAGGKGGDDDVVSWGWNVKEAFDVTLHTTINHSYGPCTYELKAERFYADGLWQHYVNARNAWERMLNSSDAKKFDFSHMTFTPFTLASGDHCYRISFVSPPRPKDGEKWKKVNVSNGGDGGGD